MPTNVELAIAKIKSIADRKCENQAYYFPGCEVDDWGNPNLEALCAKLKIPFTDDIVLKYPAKATFAPIAADRIAAAAVRLGGELPADYIRLLQEFGPFHLPGKCNLCFMSPEGVVKACEQWGFEPATAPVLLISPYHVDCDGDFMGYLRHGGRFGPELIRLHHDLRWSSEDPASWVTLVADSLAEFVTAYIDHRCRPPKAE